MAKELIVSVNGREKKIAIIENGKVTEFYIERGEGSQGIVGNIYKGRVMRVLPGMQSAFVDIGLDGDAFLYVSDVFENLEDYDHGHGHEHVPATVDTAAAPVPSVEVLPGEHISRLDELPEAESTAEEARKAFCG